MCKRVSQWEVVGLPWWPVGIESACQCRRRGFIPGWEDPLEKEMATNASLLPWEIAWIEEPGGLRSMGLQKSRT